MYAQWKKLESKRVFSHPRLNIFEDRVELPSGHVTDYLHFGDDADASMVIAINEEGSIFVQKEYSYPPNEWLYQFPGGATENNESPEEGARRELAEEGQLAAGTLKEIGWFYINNRRSASRFYVFVATDISPTKAEKDMEEDFEDFWYSENEVDELIRSGQIVNFSLLSAWALYKSMQR